MRLRVATDDRSSTLVTAGWAARVWLNDVEISQYCYGVSVDASLDGPIAAKLNLHLSDLEIDLPVLASIIDASAREVKAA